MSQLKNIIRAGSISSLEARRQKLTKYQNNLVHACKCTAQNCEQEGCEEMKSLVVHYKVCSTSRWECRPCKQFLCLSRYHAKYYKDCESDMCPIPYCAKFKFKIHLKNLRGASSLNLPSNEPSVVDLTTESDLNSWPADRRVPQREERRVGAPRLRLPHWVDILEHGEYREFPLQMELGHPVPEISYMECPSLEIPPLESLDDEFPQVPVLQVASFGVDPMFNDPQNAILLRNLLHSQRCHTEEEGALIRVRCFEQDCNQTKNLLRHISQCDLDRDCTRLHCSLAKTLLNHWGHCSRDCPLCRPVREHQESEYARLSSDYDWKSAIFPGMRNEIVKYGVAVLHSRCIYHTASVNMFLKTIELYAFNRASSLQEYCRLIAAKLATFCVNPQQVARSRREVSEEEMIGLFQALLSHDVRFKEEAVADFMRRHPRITITHMNERSSEGHDIPLLL